jgi:hypothetical protein
VDYLSRGRNHRPRRSLTFDDGYLGNFTQAFPILARHGLNATFVTTDCIDNRPPLDGLLRFVIFTTRFSSRDARPLAFRLPLGSDQEAAKHSPSSSSP